MLHRDISRVYQSVKTSITQQKMEHPIRMPRLSRNDGRYTVGGLTLVFFARHLGEIRHKRELIDFLRALDCHTTDPQPRHLGMQCGFNFLVKGCYHPQKERILRAGEFSLLDVVSAHPSYSRALQHRSTDRAFGSLAFGKLKKLYDMRCPCCGSMEGERHLKNQHCITKLEMGHMDPRLPLSGDNCIPMCNMCNMVYKNYAVFNANGFVVEWLNDVKNNAVPASSQCTTSSESSSSLDGGGAEPTLEDDSCTSASEFYDALEDEEDAGGDCFFDAKELFDVNNEVIVEGMRLRSGRVLIHGHKQSVTVSSQSQSQSKQRKYGITFHREKARVTAARYNGNNNAGLERGA